MKEISHGVKAQQNHAEILLLKLFPKMLIIFKTGTG